MSDSGPDLYEADFHTSFTATLKWENKRACKKICTQFEHRVIWSGDKQLTPMAIQFFFFICRSHTIPIGSLWVFRLGQQKINLIGIDYCTSYKNFKCSSRESHSQRESSPQSWILKKHFSFTFSHNSWFLAKNCQSISFRNKLLLNMNRFSENSECAALHPIGLLFY